MIDSLRHIKSRIKSVENTWKVTRAMEMISISKLRRVQDVLLPARTYFERLEGLFQRLLLCEEAYFSHPLFEERSPVRKIMLCVVTSDSGLCGTYNARMMEAAQDFIGRVGEEKVKLVTVGRKGFAYFKRKGPAIERAFLGLHGRLRAEVLEEISGVLTQSFLKKEADEVYIAYTRFGGAMKYRPVVEKVFPITRILCDETEYLLEPEYASLLNRLMPAYLEKRAALFFLESFASEHSERAVAMRSATDNAKNLMEGLILLRNKVRQATITKEVLEIVSSAEALKG